MKDSAPGAPCWTTRDDLYALIARCYGIELLDQGGAQALSLGEVNGFLVSRAKEDYLLVPRYTAGVLHWLYSRDRRRHLRLYCSRSDVDWFERAPDAVYQVFRTEGTPPPVELVGYHFRTLTSEDLEELETLYASDLDNPFLELDFDRMELINQPHLAAYLGKQLVAVTGTVFDMNHEFELGRDFTHLQFRRRGIQRALVSTFIRRLRVAGETRKILAWIREENEGAQRLFGALGFERIGEFCTYTLKPDELRGGV